MTTPAIHPFEKSGLGRAPFKLLYCVSLPSAAMAEANPEAYNRAMREAVQSGAKGTCEHCGMAITHNFIIESSDKRRSAVGSDCVLQTGQRSLVDPVQAEIAKIRKAQRRASAVSKHAIWLDAVCHTGETNRARIAREGAEVEARAQARRDEAAAAQAKRDADAQARIDASRHVGQIGERRQFVLTLSHSAAMPGRFGTFFIQSFTDADGATIVYKGGSPIQCDKGETVRVVAGIKDHSEYNGVKQTVIERAKVLEGAA